MCQYTENPTNMLLKEEKLRGVDRILYPTRADISRTRGTLT